MDLTPKQQSDKKRQELIMKQKESIMLIRSNESIILELKQKNIIFTKLPARLVNIILEMLAPNEVPILRCVCRWFKDYIDSNDNLIAIQVFSLFFPKQVDFFCDYGENDIFLQERAKKNYILSHNTRSQSKWRQFLKTFEDVRESFLGANYKIFLFAQEQKEKQQNNEQLNQNAQLGKNNNLNGHQKDGNTKLGGLAPLNNPDMSIDEEDNTGAPLLGFGVTSGQDDLQEEEQDQGVEQVKFKFTLEGEEDKQKMEQINENKGIFFQFNQKQSNDSQDSENINSSSQNTENQDVCSMDPQRSKMVAQRMSQLSSKYIWSVLKDPPLPILKLRRENIGNYCNTWFQNKLAEVLWEGSRQIGLGLHQCSDEEQPLTVVNNIIRDNKEYFIDEVKQFCEKWQFQKKDILNMRYYFYKNKPTFSYINRQNKKTQQSSSFTNFKQTSPKPLFSAKQGRNLSTMEEQGYNNILGTKHAFSQNSSTLVGNSQPSSNPVVFNFFDETNKDNNDSTNPSNTSQNNQNGAAKGLFDDIFQFAHKQPEQENDIFEDIDLDNSNEENNGFQADEYLAQKQQKPLLLFFIESLVDLFIFKCQLIYEYLKEHMNGMCLNESNGIKKNGFDLLSEYNIKWNSYIAFLTEIEEQLKDIFEIYNEAFDQIFEDYPQHPRMSIWRLMVKIWIQEIYSKDELKENLFGCFLKVLSIRRHENFQFQMKQIELDSKVQQQYYMPDQLEYISLTLLNNLTKNKNFSLLNYGEGYDYFHSFFSKNQYHADSLLSSFVESTIDLSLNEISVHYLGHSQVQMDSPYLQLEKQLLDSSQTYYRHQQSMFLSNPSNYLLFLKGDLKYVSKIFKERSQVQLRKKMLGHWKEMFKDIITQKLPKQLELFNEKDDKTKNLIQQHVKQQIQILKIQQQNQIQSENNLTQPTLAQQNTQSQDGEEQNQQQQQQQQQQNPQNEEQQQPNRSSDTLPSLIYQILEEQEMKQKQQDLLQMELNSKSPSVETNQILFQKGQNNNIFNDSNDIFSSEKKGIFSDHLITSNNNQNNMFEIENDDELPELPNMNNPILEEKKDISTKSNFTNQQQNLGLSQDEIDKLQEKAHILAQMFRMSDDQMKLDIQNYIETCRQIQDLNSTKTDQDLEIEELNNMRRLPLNLNNEEQTFFFLTRQLTEEILQDTIQKQRDYMRQQRESNIDADSDEEEEEEEEENDHHQMLEESEDDGNDNEDAPQFRFDDDNENDSSGEIPNSLSLKNNNDKIKNKNNVKRKKQKAKIQEEQDIPVYNSGDESDSHIDDTTTAGNKNYFSIKKQESNASDFSLGFEKEQSRLSNHILFEESNSQIQPEKQQEAIQFNFNISGNKEEEQEQQEDTFNMFQLEKQNSAPNNNVNMFSFKLQSNDSINIKSNKKPQQQQEIDQNFFANCTPTVSQNILSNFNNSNNPIKVDFFSGISNDNYQNNNTNNNQTSTTTTNTQSMFFNLLNNVNNNNNNDDEDNPFGGDIETQLNKQLSKS